MPASSGEVIPVSAALPGTTDVRLYGRWLLLARVVCLGLSLVALVIWVWGLPARYAQLGTVCATICGDQQPIPASIARFQAAGISIGFYAAYTVAVEILFALVFLFLAAVIFWRKADTGIGLLTGLLLVTVGVAQTDASALGTAVPALRGPVTGLLALSFVCIGLFLYLFPDGRFAPRWTCFIVGAWIPLFLVSTLVLPPKDFQPLLFGFLAASLFVPIYRYRRLSTPVQRQQTKWVVLGVLISTLGSISILTAQSLHVLADSPGALAFLGINTLLSLFTALIPLSIGIAILRSHLWDIDALINKALVYGALTGLLGAVYASLIIGLQSLAGAITGTSNQPVALVLSTLAIAALFQPLRNRLQAVIDRRFYRRKYDAAKTLTAFSATLRNEVDLHALREHLLDVVQETIQPMHVSLWLRPPERRTIEPPYHSEPHELASIESNRP